MAYTVKCEIGGREISVEMGRLAKQANGAALVTCGETVVLVTACGNSDPREGIDFMPLTVDYREYTYAAGKFPGGFHKREGRPTEKEILTSRLIDRPIRPLFPDGYRCETQVVAFVLSADGINDPDILAILGASCALYNSDIPFHNPLAAVRMALVDGKLVVNPTNQQLPESRLNLVVAGTESAICMVEASAQEVSEEQVLDALCMAHENIKRLVAMQKELFAQIAPEKRTVTPVEVPAEIAAEVEAACAAPILEALHTSGKLNSERRMKEVKKTYLATIPEEETDRRRMATIAFERLKEKVFREELLKNGCRPDNRSTEQIRPIDIEVGVLPRTHGSSLFTRGETQALVTVTLGTSDDSQLMDTLDGEHDKTFMVHYNFPPFSVGEVSFLRGPGRREIGHGMLAERALRAVMPSAEEFPYTVRVVSDILESNGSSSQATVCGGSLALMDAGVPIRKAVSGVAMGLVMEGERYAILTDIAGFEDHYGDMDFKVAGTCDGITALQMDIKVDGITPKIMGEALAQAHRGRMFLLEKMNTAIARPRSELSNTAPRLYVIQIAEHRIKDLIGPGGKNIKALTEQTKTKIDIENDGTVRIFGVDEASAREAVRRVKESCEEAEVGKVYRGKVNRLEAYGAFIEIIPGTDGLLHISEVSYQRTADINDVLKLGDEVDVKVIGIEPPNKVRLSMRALQEPPADMPVETDRPRPPRRPEGGRGFGDRPRGDRPRGGRS